MRTLHDDADAVHPFTSEDAEALRDNLAVKLTSVIKAEMFMLRAIIREEVRLVNPQQLSPLGVRHNLHGDGQKPVNVPLAGLRHVASAAVRKSLTMPAINVRQCPVEEDLVEEILPTVDHLSSSGKVVKVGWTEAEVAVDEKPEALVKSAPEKKKLIMMRKSSLLSRGSLRFQPIAGEGVQDYVKRMVLCNKFDYMVSALLVSNALTIGLQTDYAARYGDTPLPVAFRVVELVFCVLFTVELALRMFVWRGAFFSKGSGRGWNIFDTFIVGLQLVDEVANAVTGSDSPINGGSATNFMRLARLVRLLRILRVLRLVRFVHELRKLLYLLIASMSSFIWTVVLLFGVIYMMSVLLTQLVIDFAPKVDDLQQLSPSQIALNKYFGSVVDSSFSLFKAVTGGADWEQLSGALMENVSPYLGFLMLIYVAFASLVVLNLVTGLFVDSAMTLTRKDKESDLRQKVTKAFLRGHSREDEEEDTALTRSDFLRYSSQPAFRELWDLMGLDGACAEDVFNFLDQDGDGKLTISEFVAGAVDMQTPAKVSDIAMLARALRPLLAGGEASK
eukprot:TRINITY_DN23302_c0_g1_i1.p1 TRINITY_DN23302_c0_g1~~TRINITY_DN23302_c0_g1_i1.p1  ORF type:complete len:561 (-),score=72.19 TRINITY_DN23302_c0_g1_i1:269-1951(-)